MLSAFVNKYIENGRIEINIIRRFKKNTKIKEISQMISGVSNNGIFNMSAKELLEKYKDIKNRILEGKIRIGN